MPTEHDGTRLFRFELHFSGEFTARGLLAALREAFQVTNGSVRGVARVRAGENRRWTIGVRPESEAPVTIELPATTDCAAAGAVCAMDGRPLSNANSATVAGPLR